MADAFPYYAGFSFDWACSKIQEAGPQGELIVLDPWNGSGTTTLAANINGHKSIGTDRNPIASLVAQLRCLTPLSTRLLEEPAVSRRGTAQGKDPLSNWLDADTVARIRDWSDSFTLSSTGSHALGMVALFRVVREITKKFGGSNPTWVKRAKEHAELVCTHPNEIDRLVVEEQRFLKKRLISSSRTTSQVALLTANANRLPIAAESVDLVLTSPPYLTRIDYAVAYSRELAILGFDVFSDRSIRSSLMGTTLIRKAETDPPRFGIAGNKLLVDVKAHQSKASAGYYLKQTQQYLSDLSQGLNEITRVAKVGAVMHLVVQDSYYKDIPVPLADICIDETELRGWVLEDREAFPVRRLLTSLNKSARAYTKGEVAESVVTLRRKK
ncbi:hypothetical protein ACIQM0_29490 [Streptomyces sp. NPDC091387]|uniref:hypothetical protein n=1 Tax=Streptomyces sp. NPDC091387 TaxID=3365998 RepID=UPI0037F5D052